MAGEKDKKAKNSAEANSEPASSKKGTVKALKPKAKIVKKSPHTNVAQTIKFEGTPHVQGKKIKKKKKKSVPEGEKQNYSSEMKQKSIAQKEHNDQSQQNIDTKEKLGFRKKQKDQKKNEKGSGFGNPRNQMRKGKRAELETNQQREKKKENIGGLIFMCNAKTKPDCFHYRVMGVPLGKKDLVLGIKPGLKLFLYDFDLRLMYGIYKASSSGGVKLEPTAFAGAFPVQVRFTVHEDCYPLAESVFKKAIIENYERNKFNVELTAKQVKKLTELFRPVNVGSKLPAAILPQPTATIQNTLPVLPRENGQQHLTYKEAPSTEKEDFPHDTFLTEKEYRTYGLRAETRPNPTLPESRIVPTLEPFSMGYVREYPPTSHVREYPTRPMGEHHLRHPSAIYRDIAPPLGEPARHDPLLPSGKDYKAYGLGPRQELKYSIPSVDPYPYPLYPSNYGSSSADPYSAAPRRDEVPYAYSSLSGSRENFSGETDYLRRRETYLTESDYLSRRGSYLVESDLSKRRESDGAEGLYSSHASSALSDYNRTRDYTEARPEPSSLASVSARYSFAGPSLSYR